MLKIFMLLAALAGKSSHNMATKAKKECFFLWGVMMTILGVEQKLGCKVKSSFPGSQFMDLSYQF